MSKNYDQIATVSIDIVSPIVDDASFDNLLIMGPAPKGEYNAPDVGVYSSLNEVEEAGFVSTGDNADPVGVAARVAFSQSPPPTQVYIAVQKLSEEAQGAAETIKEANSIVQDVISAEGNVTGCTITFNENARRLYIVLEGPISEINNTGLVEKLTEKGYTVSVDGVAITGLEDLSKLPVFGEIAAMEQGSEDITLTVTVEHEGALPVSYGVTVSYPETNALVTSTQSDSEEEPIDNPDKVLEDPTATISRALGTSGWYVLCTAGVDAALYEDIAAYIETQEKMFCYTELNFFGAGDEGEDKPSVGSVYYRSFGIFGKESSAQAVEDIPEANLYLNVAWVTKWLNYESGSETAAFKTLSTVYPSALTTTEMKSLADNSLNYFITVGNKNISMNGKVLAGEWADVIRFRDWLKNDMQVRVVNLFVTRPKVPYTDPGISLVQNQMIASLKAGQDAGGIAPEEFDEDGNSIPGYTTSVPLASSLTASEKASRTLRNCKFSARLAGAIHFAELTGSLTYELQ